MSEKSSYEALLRLTRNLIEHYNGLAHLLSRENPKRATSTIVEKVWKSKGLRCMVLFVRQSHRCGYVAVPKRHPAFKLDYDKIPVSVHGGLTYGDFKLHMVKTNKKWFWFGFDCSHAGDKSFEIPSGHFWTKAEVIKETNKLAEQLSKLTLQDIVVHHL